MEFMACELFIGYPVKHPEVVINPHKRNAFGELVSMFIVCMN